MAQIIGYSCYALAVLFGIGAIYCWPSNKDSATRWWDSMDGLLEFLSLAFEPGGWKAVTLTVLAVASLVTALLLTVGQS